MEVLKQLLSKSEADALDSALAAVEEGPLPPEVAQILRRVWPNHSATLFPGANPRSVMRDDLPLPADTLVGPKTDGTRQLLFITTQGNFLVDRCMRAQGPTWEAFGPALRQGTLLDCELVRTTQGDALVAFDCYAHCGDPLHHLAFDARINVAARVRERGYAHHPNDPWQLRVKRFVPLQMAEAVLASRHDHAIDGLILQPQTSVIQTGMASDIYKWKHHHTVDLALVPVTPPDCVKPVMAARGRIEDAGQPMRVDLHRLGIPWHRLAHIPPPVVECSFDPNTGQWVPIKLRNDKDHPNDKYVVHRTIQNVREQLTPAQLMVTSATRP